MMRVFAKQGFLSCSDLLMIMNGVLRVSSSFHLLSLNIKKKKNRILYKLSGFYFVYVVGYKLSAWRTRMEVGRERVGVGWGGGGG